MISFFLQKNKFVKMRERYEKMRCRLAGGEESFVLYFFFLEHLLSESVVSICRTTEGYHNKKKQGFSAI